MFGKSWFSWLAGYNKIWFGLDVSNDVDNMSYRSLNSVHVKQFTFLPFLQFQINQQSIFWCDQINSKPKHEI